MANFQNVIPQDISPSEGENTIKQYHCTHLHSKLLGLKADGLLAITNKRVIFHAKGSSLAGTSIVQSEIPMEDVSGISVYKGNYFSIKHFILGIFVMIVFQVVFFLLSGIITINNYNSASGVYWFFGIATACVSPFIPHKYIWKTVLGGISILSFLCISGTSILGGFSSNMMTYGGSNNSWVIILAIAALIYTIIELFLFARRLTMSLGIGSKGGASVPIYISGVSSLTSSNAAAPKALESEPTPETEIMIKELGAVVIDIQTLGDLGIEKWKVK